MNNHQVAHVWAQQTKPGAMGSSFYFDGPTIYSYGPHFPIARFIERKGRRAVLFTTRSYSVSTSKHIGYARGAIPGSLPVFYVSDVSAMPRNKDTRQMYESRVKDASEQAARARTSAEFHLGRARGIATEANACAEFFGWRWRLKLPEFSPEFLRTVRERATKDSARKAAEIKRREDQRRAEMAERVTRWRTGENVSTWGHPDTLLRVNGNRIQTSRGAEVPTRVAPAVWSLVQDARAKGAELSPGLEIGEFRLDRVAPDGTIYAGCHTIPYAELCAVARTLGLAS